MKSIRKIIITVIALFTSNACLAAFYMPPPAPPPEKSWFVGLEMNYMEPISNDLHYAEQSVVTGEGPPSIVINHAKMLNPSFDFGFMLEGGYHFNKTNDITLNWMRFSQGKTSSVEGAFNAFDDSGLILVGRFGEDQLPSHHVDGRVNLESNIFNLEFGHTSRFGRHTTYRLHGGLQIADIEGTMRVDHEFTCAFPDDPIPEPEPPQSLQQEEHGDHISIVDNYRVSSAFTGVGPRFGADGEYHLANDYSVVMESAFSILIGNLDTTHSVKEYSSKEIPGDDDLDMFESQTNLGVHNLEFDNLTTNCMSERVIVPTFDAKLGVKRDYPLKNVSVVGDGILSVEAGYRVVAVLDVIKWLPRQVDNNNSWPSQYGLHGVYLLGRFTAT